MAAVCVLVVSTNAAPAPHYWKRVSQQIDQSTQAYIAICVSSFTFLSMFLKYLPLNRNAWVEGIGVCLHQASSKPFLVLARPATSKMQLIEW